MASVDFDRVTTRAERQLLPSGGPVARRSLVRATRYDAAQTHTGNEKHWQYANGLSAVASNAPEVRKILRNRSRYEIANNSYASGIVETLANDIIGTGPRLQMQSGDVDLDRLVEREFSRWAIATGLAAKLRTMKVAQAGDGEVFGLLRTNDAIRHRVKLDLLPLEADHITAPGMLDPLGTDGIEYDAFGNPTRYLMLPRHPGDLYSGFGADPIPIPADDMLHWFRVRRPGQRRGVPDITPALPLFAMLRRFTLAVIAAAETAASHAGVLHTDAPPDDGGYEIDPLDTFEIVRGMFTSLPDGWKLAQLKAEQPTTTYGDFKRQILSEISRCLHIPYGLAAGDHSPYNYASGRLDHLLYQRAVLVEQDDIAYTKLDHLLAKWFEEAALIEGYLPQELRRADLRDEMPEHEWFWDGFDDIDPSTAAKSDTERLGNGTATLRQLFSRQGRDVDQAMEEQAKDLGLSIDEYRRRLADKLLGPVKPTEAPASQEANADA